MYPPWCPAQHELATEDGSPETVDPELCDHVFRTSQNSICPYPGAGGQAAAFNQ